MSLEAKLSKEKAHQLWDELVECDRITIEETTEMEISEYLSDEERDVYQATGDLPKENTHSNRKDKHTALNKKRNPRPKTVPKIPYIRNEKDVYRAMFDVMKGKRLVGDYLFVKKAGVYEHNLSKFKQILDGQGEVKAEEYALQFIRDNVPEKKQEVKYLG